MSKESVFAIVNFSQFIDFQKTIYAWFINYTFYLMNVHLFQRMQDAIIFYNDEIFNYKMKPTVVVMYKN